MDELDAYKGDNDDGLIAVADIPQQPPHAPLIIDDTDDKDVENNEGADDTESNDEESNDKDDAESNNDEPSDSAATTDLDGNEPGEDRGVRRSRRRGKGITKKYAD